MQSYTARYFEKRNFFSFILQHVSHQNGATTSNATGGDDPRLPAAFSLPAT